MRSIKEKVEIISAIDEMIDERRQLGISDEQKTIFNGICESAPKSHRVEWMKSYLYDTVKDFDKTLILYNHDVMSTHNASRGYRERLLRNAVEQNSLYVIKQFLNQYHVRYSISIWFYRDAMYDYDVDNVAKLFMDALHRPPDQFWQYAPPMRLIPIMLDDGRVDELHVYKNAYMGNSIPYGLFAKLEIR